MAIDAIIVDENGIRIKSFNEIRSALAADYKSVFSDMNTEPSSPDGMLIDLVAYAVMEVAQNIQSIYANMDVSSAQGVFLDAISNIAGLGGRIEGESDDDLRIRISKGSTDGLATFDNMLSYLQRFLGSGVKLSSNDDVKSDGNIPAHSVTVFIPSDCTEGNDFIAQKIFECKGAGIKTYGNSFGVAVDSSGSEHTIYFSTIVSTSYDLKIILRKYSEESIPSTYESDVKQAILSWANEKMGPGKDIIPQRIASAIYENVDGIENIRVLVKPSSGSDWSENIVRVDNDTNVSFSDENITIELVG